MKGVLAHEMAHIANRDILVMTIAAMIGAAIAAIANILQFSMFFGGGDDEDNNPLGIVGVLVAVIVAPLAATILQLAVSRQREYLADATAAGYLGEGRPLAEALGTLQRGVEAVPMNVNPATEALYIANPLSKRGHDGDVLDAPADGGADPPAARARRRVRDPLQNHAPGGSGGGSSGLSGSRRRSRPPRLRRALARPVGPPASARQQRRRARAPGGAAGHRRARARGELARRRRRRGGECVSMAQTQAQLYGELDLALSWSERELPERERTKHVHRPPVPRQVRPAARRGAARAYVRPGGRVLDPFAGSGTTLVQALESGYDAVGVDIAAFNALLISVKTREHDLELLAADVREVAGDSARRASRRPASCATGTRRRPPRAAPLPLVDPEYASQDVLRVVLARAARSARLTTHFDLDFPRLPQRGEYWCQHRRTCRRSRARQVPDALSRRHADRIAEFASVRDPRRAAVVYGDARELELGGPYDGVITSPPYPGLIDYHEQHRYAYELLGLDDRRERELGAAARGTSKAAIEEYVAGIAAVLARSKSALRRGARSASSSTTGAGSIPNPRARRAAARRPARAACQSETGRRAGEYFESILVCR